MTIYLILLTEGGRVSKFILTAKLSSVYGMHFINVKDSLIQCIPMFIYLNSYSQTFLFK